MAVVIMWLISQVNITGLYHKLLSQVNKQCFNLGYRACRAASVPLLLDFFVIHSQAYNLYDNQCFYIEFVMYYQERVIAETMRSANLFLFLFFIVYFSSPLLYCGYSFLNTIPLLAISYVLLQLCIFQGSFPARLKKVLIVLAPLWFKAPFAILRLFVKQKLRDRVRILSQYHSFAFWSFLAVTATLRARFFLTIIGVFIINMQV